MRFLDPIYKPLKPVCAGFGCQGLGLQQFLKPAGIGVCGHASWYSWKRRGDPGDVQALPQLVGAPECTLPRLFILARVGDLIAVPAEEKTVREEQLGEAPATTSSRVPRAEEIGAEATEIPRHTIERDGLGYVFPCCVRADLI